MRSRAQRIGGVEGDVRGACTTATSHERVSHPVALCDLLQDFASGFAFGQVMQTYGVQPDFERFEYKRTPDAMVNNYTRLQASTGECERRCPCRYVSMLHHAWLQPQASFQKLGIKFDSRTANALMREEPGVALRLLYSLKQNLTQMHKDVQVRIAWEKRKERGEAVCMHTQSHACHVAWPKPS